MRILPGEDPHTELAAPVVPSQVTVHPRSNPLPAEPRCRVSVTLSPCRQGPCFPAFPLQTRRGGPAAHAGGQAGTRALAGSATAALESRAVPGRGDRYHGTRPQEQTRAGLPRWPAASSRTPPPETFS